MLLYFHRENEINNISSQASFKFFDKSYFAEVLLEAYLEPSRTSTMELFCENS